VALGFGVVQGETPVYEASSKVFVSRTRQQTNADVLSLSDEQLLAINLQLAKSQPVLDEVSSQLGSKVDADNIQVGALPNSLIIQVKVQDADPQRAAEIANLLIQTLIQQNDALLLARYSAFETSINVQVDEVQKQIDSLQTQITQINETGLQEQLAQVNQQIEQLKTETATLERETANLPTYPTPLERASYAEKQAQLAQLNSLLTLYQQIQTNLLYIGKPVQSGTSLENPRLAILQSTLNLYQQMNLTLIGNRENIRLAREQSRQNVMKIVSATPSKDPVRPMPVLYVLLGGVVGLALAVTAVLVFDYFDDSIKTACQVENMLDLPVLGNISNIGNIKNGLVTLKNPFSEGADGFRSLGASLEIIGAGKDFHTVMILNARPSAVRTNIAANLAVINAQQGKWVILLDGDLKHPRLHQFFGMENKKGLAELIENRLDIERARLAVKDVDGLTLIPSGLREEDSTTWLNAEKLAELLSGLQSQADLVIIDGPSVDSADAQILASKVDAVLLVVRLGHTRLGAAQNTLRRFQVIGANLVGAVLDHRPQHQPISKQLVSWFRGKFTKKRKTGQAENKVSASAVSAD
jgi:capsular exopolysaccharide synthesis family protein